MGKRNKNNNVDLDKTNSYDLVFDDDRMKDSKSLDVSFIDGKKKKAPKIDMTEYKYESDELEYPKDKKGEAFSIILIIILSFVLGCLFFYILVRNDLNSTSDEIKVQTETKVVMDDNYVFLGDFIFDEYDLGTFYSNMNVVNSSGSEDKTIDVLENIKERVYQYNPSKVFIMIGTNDIESGLTLEDISLNIERIVNSILDNRSYAEIYVLSICPVNSSDDDKISHDVVGDRLNTDIQELNKLIKNMCGEKNITYIDFYNKLIDEEGNLDIDYTEDGLHINEEGYKIITDEVLKYINEE